MNRLFHSQHSLFYIKCDACIQLKADIANNAVHGNSSFSKTIDYSIHHVYNKRANIDILGKR